MEFTVILLSFGLLYIHNVELVSGLSLRRLNEKIDILEAKLGVENKQRHIDYENIMSKLNEITTQLGHRDKQPSIGYSKIDTTDGNSAIGGVSKSVSDINNQLQYLMKGLTQEKKKNGITRQKLPNIERTIDKINHRVKRELSMLDSEITTVSLECKAHTESMSLRIEDLANVSQDIYLIVKIQNDKLSRMETETTRTSAHIEMLSNTLNNSHKRNDEQFENIPRIVDEIVANHIVKCEKIQTQLEATINKQCQIEGSRKPIVTSTESPATTSIPVPDSTETTQNPPTDITSCKDEYKNGNRHSGVYTVYNNGNKQEVYCDQTTEGGGWTVFQRRVNGDVDFYRDWESYQIGFGDLTGNFWLGNEYLSSILENGQHQLRIDMEDFEGNRAYAKYSSFLIDPESDHYKLHVSGFSGTGGDALEYHNGQKFSTKDVDLDQSSISCSNRYKGGWWYGNCHHSNLNGLYHNTSEDKNYDGLSWGQYEWKQGESLKFVEMKFR